MKIKLEDLNTKKITEYETTKTLTRNERYKIIGTIKKYQRKQEKSMKKMRFLGFLRLIMNSFIANSHNR